MFGGWTFSGTGEDVLLALIGGFGLAFALWMAYVGTSRRRGREPGEATGLGVAATIGLVICGLVVLASQEDLLVVMAVATYLAVLVFVARVGRQRDDETSSTMPTAEDLSVEGRSAVGCERPTGHHARRRRTRPRTTHVRHARQAGAGAKAHHRNSVGR